MCFPLFWFANATPLKAQLSLSLPHDVKKISSGFAPKQAAIVSLEASRAFLLFLPKEYTLEALPYSSRKYGSIASKTSFLTGVVAALSR